MLDQFWRCVLGGFRGDNAFFKIHSTGCEAVSLYLSSSHAFPHRISCDLRGAARKCRCVGYSDRALVGSADQSQDDGVLGGVPVSFRYDPVCVLLEVAGGRYPKGVGKCRNFFNDVPLYGAHSVL